MCSFSHPLPPYDDKGSNNRKHSLYVDVARVQSESDVMDSFSVEQQKKKTHHYILCKKRDCLGVSKEKRECIKTQRCLTTASSLTRIWLITPKYRCGGWSTLKEKANTVLSF